MKHENNVPFEPKFFVHILKEEKKNPNMPFDFQTRFAPTAGIVNDIVSLLPLAPIF